MKKSVVFYLIGLLLTLVCFEGCTSESDEASGEGSYYEVTIPEEIPKVNCKPTVVSGEQGDIRGIWRLVRLTERDSQSRYVEPLDYSCARIQFEFADNSLIISGDVAQFEQGQHTYKFTGNPIGCPVCLPGPNFSIDEVSECYCIVMKSVMSIVFPTCGMFFVRVGTY